MFRVGRIPLGVITDLLDLSMQGLTCTGHAEVVVVAMAKLLLKFTDLHGSPW